MVVMMQPSPIRIVERTMGRCRLGTEIDIGYPYGAAPDDHYLPVGGFGLGVPVVSYAPRPIFILVDCMESVIMEAAVSAYNKKTTGQHLREDG